MDREPDEAVTVDHHGAGGEADPELEQLLNEEAAIGADDLAAAAAAAPAVAPGKHEGPFGKGSHAPLDDPDTAPEGFLIKGNADSMLYHVPDSAFYARTTAEVWFANEDAAEGAGFSKPASQQDDAEKDS